jgi:hypothetical protein
VAEAASQKKEAERPPRFATRRLWRGRVLATPCVPSIASRDVLEGDLALQSLRRFAPAAAGTVPIAW